MVTQNNAQQAYITARNKLLDIAGSYEASEEQIQKASDSAVKLADDFIGQNITDAGELTISYQSFVTYMQEAISSLEEAGPIGVVTDLKEALTAIEPAFSD